MGFVTKDDIPATPTTDLSPSLNSPRLIEVSKKSETVKSLSLGQGGGGQGRPKQQTPSHKKYLY